MPDTVQPLTPATPKAPPSSTPPGGTNTSATASPPPAPVATAAPTSAPSAEPFRFPDTHPVTWARGKTPEEVLQVARGYEEAFNTGRAFAAPAPSAAPAPPTPMANSPFRFPDDD